MINKELADINKKKQSQRPNTKQEKTEHKQNNLIELEQIPDESYQEDF